MKKSLQRVIISLILLTILSADVDYKAKYQEQVANNLNLKNHIQYQDKLISDLDKEIEIQKIKEKERMLIYIPWTEIGISKDHCIGFLIGFIIFKVV